MHVSALLYFSLLFVNVLQRFQLYNKSTPKFSLLCYSLPRLHCSAPDDSLSLRRQWYSS